MEKKFLALHLDLKHYIAIFSTIVLIARIRGVIEFVYIMLRPKLLFCYLWPGIPFICRSTEFKLSFHTDNSHGI